MELIASVLYLIDFALNDFFNKWMLITLSCHTPVTTTDDQHFLGICMAIQWQERQHLLIREFIKLRCLNTSIQGQYIAELLTKNSNYQFNSIETSKTLFFKNLLVED